MPTDFRAVTGKKTIQTLGGFTFQVDTGTIDTEKIGVFKGKKLTITAEEGTSIVKVELTCVKNGTEQYGPGCFTDQDATSHYTYSGKNGTWENAAGQQKVSLKASTNQVRINKIVITYIA